jgi:polysaccharide export outer membrane protein
MMKRVTIALAALTSGCFMAPGIRISDSDMTSRYQEAGDKDFQVQPVTPQVIARLLEQRGKEREKRAPDPLATEAANYQYRIAPNDILSVTVWEHPELTIPFGAFRGPEENGVQVYANGTMYYPYVGLVQVAGKTIQEVREDLVRGLKKVIENPQVSVRVGLFRGKRVEVTGEVKTPSTLPVTDIPLRVSDAIVRAGGLVPESDPSHVTLKRGGKSYTLDMTSFYEEGDLRQNWLLVDGDILHVADRSRSQVYVFGEVKKMGTRPMPRGRMSLAQALADSEGFDYASLSPSGIYVLREQAGKPVVFRLDAGSADALVLAAQFPLEHRDVVFVETNGLANYNRVASQILPTVTAIWQAWDIVRWYAP